MELSPIAIVTMVYNEKLKMPFWLSHYEAQVGLKHCYVVDHGSTDGSTDKLYGASKIQIPRSEQNNEKRLELINHLCRALLQYYKYVVYVDGDELLVADPDKYANLTEYAKALTADYVTSIGLEICHARGENDLDNEKPIGEQRSYALYSSSMCKTNLIGKPVKWAPGWHSHDGKPQFNDLYLFHLRHADMKQALDRLAITRNMPWVREDAGRHQRVKDEEMAELVKSFGSHEKLELANFLAENSPLPAQLEAFVQGSSQSAPERPYSVPLAVYGNKLLSLNAKFKAAISAPMLK